MNQPALDSPHTRLRIRRREGQHFHGSVHVVQEGLPGEELRVQVPSGLTANNAAPVVVLVGGVSSQSGVTIATN